MRAPPTYVALSIDSISCSFPSGRDPKMRGNPSAMFVKHSCSFLSTGLEFCRRFIFAGSFPFSQGEITLVKTSPFFHLSRHPFYRQDNLKFGDCLSSSSTKMAWLSFWETLLNWHPIPLADFLNALHYDHDKNSTYLFRNLLLLCN